MLNSFQMVDKELTISDTNYVEGLSPVLAEPPIVGPNCDGVAIGEGLGSVEDLVLCHYRRL